MDPVYSTKKSPMYTRGLPLLMLVATSVVGYVGFSSLYSNKHVSTIQYVHAPSQERQRGRFEYHTDIEGGVEALWMASPALSSLRSSYRGELSSSTTLNGAGADWTLPPEALQEELTFTKDATSGDVETQQTMERFVKHMQKKITSALEELEGPDGARFRADPHATGNTMVMQGGKVFEKAGVAVSVIQGKLPPEKAKAMLKQQDLEKEQGFTEEELKSELPYFASGISLVFHPNNPHAPTVHMNLRYFEVSRQSGQNTWWFGGGADLTPSYIYDEDAVHFHQTYKDTCDAIDTSYYPAMKKECDEYFTITHRNETRGVGGIFFDGMSIKTGKSKPELLELVYTVADSLIPAYVPLVKKNMDKPFTEKQKEFQQIRRGRYVEYNLVYDRGTKFGLAATKGVRIESVLLSLPLHVQYQYMYEPEPGSPEEYTQKILKHPKDWL